MSWVITDNGAVNASAGRARLLPSREALGNVTHDRLGRRLAIHAICRAAVGFGIIRAYNKIVGVFPALRTPWSLPMKAVSENAGKLVFLLAIVFLKWGTCDQSQAVAGDQPKHRFPDVTLITQDNEAVSFRDDLVKDKVVLINFMYTECESCTKGTQNLGEVQKALGDRLGKEV